LDIRYKVQSQLLSAKRESVLELVLRRLGIIGPKYLQRGKSSYSATMSAQTFGFKADA